MVDFQIVKVHDHSGRTVMTEEIKLPRGLSEEPKAPAPRRASHQKVIEQIDRWANSSGLQPPKAPDPKTA
jgi:hypothetical protein